MDVETVVVDRVVELFTESFAAVLVSLTEAAVCLLQKCTIPSPLYSNLKSPEVLLSSFGGSGSMDLFYFFSHVYHAGTGQKCDGFREEGRGDLDEKGFGGDSIFLNLSFDVEVGQRVSILLVGEDALSICPEASVDSPLTDSTLEDVEVVVLD